MSASAVRGWVNQDEAGEGIGGMGILSDLERQELSALKKENKQLRMERDILKKAEFPIVTLSKVMDLLESGFHAWKHRPESRRASENRNLKAQVAAAFAESRETYGSTRIQSKLRSRGISIGKHYG